MELLKDMKRRQTKQDETITQQELEQLQVEVGYVEEENIVPDKDLYGDNDVEGEDLLHG